MSERPLNERVAIVEADNASMKSAVFEIKDAIVAIRSTLDTVVRIEERSVTLATNDARLSDRIDAERRERLKSCSDLGTRIGDQEKKTQALESQTNINSHGRSLFEKVMVPVVAAILGSIITVGLASLAINRSESLQTNIMPPRIEQTPPQR